MNNGRCTRCDVDIGEGALSLQRRGNAPRNEIANEITPLFEIIDAKVETHHTRNAHIVFTCRANLPATEPLRIYLFITNQKLDSGKRMVNDCNIFSVLWFFITRNAFFVTTKLCFSRTIIG